MKLFEIKKGGLEKGRSYTIAKNCNHLPKDLEWARGQKAKVINIVGRSVSVTITGKTFLIPTYCLITFEDYEINSRVSLDKADLIAVIGRNAQMQVGVVFQGNVTITEDIASISTGKEKIQIHTNVLVGMMNTGKKLEAKEIETSVNKLAERFGHPVSVKPERIVKTNVISLPATEVVTSNECPTAFLNNLPLSILNEIDSNLNNLEREWYDYNGKQHNTLNECNKSNNSILLELKLHLVVNVCQTELNKRKNK